MERSVWILAFAMIINVCMAQTNTTLDWAPVGAKWYYEVELGTNFISYVVFTVEKDTLVNGYMCKKIIIDKTDTTYPGCPWVLEPSTLPYVNYQPYVPSISTPPFALSRISNDTIYFYSWKCSTFVASAYNLSNIGDIWKPLYDNKENDVPPPPNYCNMINTLIITNIDTIMLGNFKLKRFRFSNYQSSYIYIENIGYTWGLGPPDPFMLIDAFTLWGLRCYYHPTYGWLQYDVSKPCDYVYVGIKEWTVHDEFLAYLDANKQLIVDIKNNIHYPIELTISTMLGEVVYKTSLPHFKPVSLPALSSQILVISVKDNKSRIYHKKLYYYEK